MREDNWWLVLLKVLGGTVFVIGVLVAASVSFCKLL